MNFTLHRRGRRVWALLRGVAATLLWLPAPLALAALASYGALVPMVAAPEEIATATGDVPSVVRSARGLQIGGLERGARPWTPYASISPAFVRAIVASEDVRFFAHEGVDPENALATAEARVLITPWLYVEGQANRRWALTEQGSARGDYTPVDDFALGAGVTFGF